MTILRASTVLLICVPLVLAGCGGGADDTPSAIAVVTSTPDISPTSDISSSDTTSSSAATDTGGSRPSEPVGPTTPTATPYVPPSPKPFVCKPLPDSGPDVSSLQLSGQCSFTETKAMLCPNNAQNTDDFYFQFQRNLPNGLQLFFKANIEKYHGAGTYSTTSVIMEVPDNSVTYEWDTQTATVTVNADNHSGSVARSEVPASVGTPTQGSEFMQGTFTCG